MENLSFEFIFRLVFAAILGGTIGLERNYRAKDAGFRTHFLVALGSALFMLVSQYGFDLSLEKLSKISWDPSRIASQVVTGIGFIGAGTIIFQKHVIRGLTTAAGLWVTSAIGLTCGAGMYLIATAATLLVLLCLEALNFLLSRFGAKNILLSFKTKDKEEIGSIIKQLKRCGVAISNYTLKEKCDGSYLLTIEAKVSRKNYDSQVQTLLQEESIVDVENIE